jgi:hypothetical protein
MRPLFGLPKILKHLAPLIDSLHEAIMPQNRRQGKALKINHSQYRILDTFQKFWGKPSQIPLNLYIRVIAARRNVGR